MPPQAIAHRRLTGSADGDARVGFHLPKLGLARSGVIGPVARILAAALVPMDRRAGTHSQRLGAASLPRVNALTAVPRDRRVANGLARGAVAAMTMSAVRQVTTSFGLVQQTPPDAILKQRALGILVRSPKVAYFVARRQIALVELAHWGYGAMGGAAFAMLPSSLLRRRWIGPGYGLVTWLVFELSVAPILGLAQSQRIRVVERLMFLGDHLLYGSVLASDRRSWALPRRRSWHLRGRRRRWR